MTGATDGIGFATAKALLAQGASVFVHGRSEKRASVAIARMGDEINTQRAIPVYGDFSEMTEVIGLALQVQSKTNALDVLINNAAIYPSNREISRDGMELTMAVNYFAPFLLTNKLIPELTRAKEPRVINVSSMTHSGASLDLSDLPLSKNWSAYGAYATSKLANILFTKELVRQQEKNGVPVSSYCLHPGVIDTKLLRGGFSIKGDSAENGARTSIYLATEPRLKGKNGAYYVDCRPSKPSFEAMRTDLAGDLWRLTTEALADFINRDVS